MTRVTSALGARFTDLVYASLALVAAVLTLIGEGLDPRITTLVVVSLVPWVLIVAGVRLPLVAFAVLAIVPLIPVVVLTGIGAAIFLTLVAASRLASCTDQRWLLGVVTAVVVVLPFTAYLFGFGEWDVGAIYFAFGGAFGVLVGVLLRRSNRLADELRLADVELAEAAAREERHRIARDVHDLVAHSLTVVVLHVGGARRVLRSDPDAAEVALVEAERVSRESLDAIRGAVGLLRDDDGPDVRSLDLERLAATYRSAGLPVELRIEGKSESLPLAVRLTLYRVVQEALANAARHSTPGTPTSVEISIGSERVVARIANEHVPNSAQTSSGSGGYGLLGLREQAASLGGELASGADGARWVVECTLPIGGTS
jgi:signal transduction histidine kinase